MLFRSLLIASYLSGGPDQTSRRSGARPEVDWSQHGLPNPSPSNPNRNSPRRPRRADAVRLRRRQSPRNEPGTLEGLGIGGMGVHNRAGLGPESQGRLNDRVADIMGAARQDVEDGSGGEPMVLMRHWDRG